MATKMTENIKIEMTENLGIEMTDIKEWKIIHIRIIEEYPDLK